MAALGASACGKLRRWRHKREVPASSSHGARCWRRRAPTAARGAAVGDASAKGYDAGGLQWWRELPARVGSDSGARCWRQQAPAAARGAGVSGTGGRRHLSASTRGCWHRRSPTVELEVAGAAVLRQQQWWAMARGAATQADGACKPHF
ncbi:unnamed protein product [Urochloa humidicola]